MMVAETPGIVAKSARKPRRDRTARVLSLLPPPSSGESRLVMGGRTWQDYLALDAERERRGGFRVTYLEGVIELMFPSFEHEIRKSNVSRVLEAWLEECDIDFTIHGSTTLRSEIKEAGKEPDESYAFGEAPRARPDLAIEIAITSGGIDTLEIYRRFEVPEVWIWQKNELRVFALDTNGYVTIDQSRLFPALDLGLLAECALIEKTSEARKTFLAKLRAR